MWIEMHVEDLWVDTETDQPVLVLVEAYGQRTLPISMGMPEAGAIASALEGIRFTRPMTHDLLGATIQGLGARVVQVAIHDIQDDAFMAIVRLESADRALIELDARPSDAIALALRCHAPVLASSALLSSASAVSGRSGSWRGLKRARRAREADRRQDRSHRATG